MAVRLSNTQKKIKVPSGRLRRAAASALSLLGLSSAELSITVTGDRKMRTLNRQYRGVDRTTDVLSFSMLEAEEAGPSEKAGGPPLALGDIVISAPQAMRQAEELGHPLEDELIFLTVHGILHIIGYDHEAGPAEARKMYAKQREVIRLLKTE